MNPTAEWIELIKTGGVIAVLCLNLYFLVSGKVIPKEIVDTMMKRADDRTLKLTAEIKDGIKEAVTQGIIMGINEVRKVAGE